MHCECSGSSREIWPATSVRHSQLHVLVLPLLRPRALGDGDVTGATVELSLLRHRVPLNETTLGPSRTPVSSVATSTCPGCSSLSRPMLSRDSSFLPEPPGLFTSSDESRGETRESQHDGNTRLTSSCVIPNTEMDAWFVISCARFDSHAPEDATEEHTQVKSVSLSPRVDERPHLQIIRRKSSDLPRPTSYFPEGASLL